MKLCRKVLLCGFILSGSITIVAQQRRRTTESATGGKPNAAMIQARRDYESRCSSCHGLDGRGGEHGANISTDPAIRRLPDRDIFRVVHDGIASKGMPAFDHLTDGQIKSLVSYLRFMSGPHGSESLNGNPHHGEELFYGKAECGHCHMMRGKGGFLGSDLTEYAASHAPGEARDAILNPGQLRDPHQEMVVIVTRGGERLSGVACNEDNFSLQLLGEDGAFHMLLKSDAERLERSDNPVMPVDYGQRLTRSELDDLDRYLAQGARRTEHPLIKTIHSGSR